MSENDKVQVSVASESVPFVRGDEVARWLGWFLLPAVVAVCLAKAKFWASGCPWYITLLVVLLSIRAVLSCLLCLLYFCRRRRSYVQDHAGEELPRNLNDRVFNERVVAPLCKGSGDGAGVKETCEPRLQTFVPVTIGDVLTVILKVVNWLLSLLQPVVYWVLVMFKVIFGIHRKNLQRAIATVHKVRVGAKAAKKAATGNADPADHPSEQHPAAWPQRSIGDCCCYALLLYGAAIGAYVFMVTKCTSQLLALILVGVCYQCVKTSAEFVTDILVMAFVDNPKLLTAERRKAIAVLSAVVAFLPWGFPAYGGGKALYEVAHSCVIAERYYRNQSFKRISLLEYYKSCLTMNCVSLSAYKLVYRLTLDNTEKDSSQYDNALSSEISQVLLRDDFAEARRLANQIGDESKRELELERIKCREELNESIMNSLRDLQNGNFVR